MNKAFVQAQAAFLTDSGWFDAAWYLHRCPAALGSGLEPLSHYLAYGAAAGIGPNGWLDSLQCAGGSVVPPLPGACDVDVLLRLEMELLEACGLFDPAYYLEHNRDIARKGLDPLEHFCRAGWQELRKPHPGFDVWWYWSSHLDPCRATVNPLVHYALIGLSAGYRGLPRPHGPTAGKTLDHEPRRICLFAGFDPDGIADETVVALVRELSRFSDVYYLADCTMSEHELGKLQPYTKARWAYRHGTYDFGSWAELAAKHVGWDRIQEYDELLLVNDSVYLLDDLGPVFTRMESRECDWWGLQATKGMYATRHAASNQFDRPIPMASVSHDRLDEFANDYVYDFHVGSYFLAFRRSVLGDPGFRYRLSLKFKEPSKARLVRKREIALTQYLLDRGFEFATFIDCLFPLHPIFTAYHFELIANGFPFLKRLFLVTNHYDTPGLAEWKDCVLMRVPGAPVEMIERNLLRVADHDKLQRSFSIRGGADGKLRLPKLLNNRQFRRRDMSTPRRESWWAFAVDPVSGVLGGNERAIFEAVRNDPAITKIVLTRWRQLEYAGENVIVHPLVSAKGQQHLLRSGRVFVAGPVRQWLTFPVSALRRTIHDLGAADGSALVDGAGGAAQLPRWDIVRCRHEQLPHDMQREAHQLAALCGNRRLLLFTPVYVPDADSMERVFPSDQVDRLLAALRRHGMCLVIRGQEGADTIGLSRHFAGRELLDLPVRCFPSLELVMRKAAIVVTDAQDCIAGLNAAGSTVLEFLAVLDIATDFSGLCRALETRMARSVLALSDRSRGEAVSAAAPGFATDTTWSNAERIVRQIREVYEGQPSVAEPSP